MVDFSPARRAMVDGQLRTADVTRTDILDIFSVIPREIFVDAAEQSVAYADRAVLSVGEAGRKILPPMVLARMIQATDIKAGDQILDIGAGAGYSTALMAGLGGQVTLLEDSSTQCSAAKEVLGRLETKGVIVQQGELALGVTSKTSFDIIVGADIGKVEVFTL